MARHLRFIAFSCAFAWLSIGSAARAQDLASFAILAGSAITNTGPSVITGNIGLSPGSSIVGFPPGVVVAPYAIFQTDAVAASAQVDLTTAYNVLAGEPATADLTGQNLGGQTLSPGVYNFNASAQLTGTLTLDGQGNPNAIFIINVGSALTTASGSVINLINGAKGANVFFRVGSSATLGSGSLFAGQIYALTSITLVTGADIVCGAALARNGAVTLDTNTITVCPVPAITLGPPTSLPPAANGISSVLASGGTLPLTFQVLLAVLTPAQLRSALAQLSGETGTGAAPTGMQAMDSFMSLIFDTVDEEDEREAAAPAPVQQEVPATVTTLDYAEEPSLFGRSSPFGSLVKPVATAAPATPAWTTWAAGFGSRSSAFGNADLGTHDRSSNVYGFAGGVDYKILPTTRIGFAISGGRTTFGLSDSLGSGSSDVVQTALYGRTNVGPAYVAAAVAYAWNDVSTLRIVTIGGSDQLRGAFKAGDVAGQIETGYRVGWFIPYAGFGVQSFHTPSYSETDPAGPSLFALSYRSQTEIAPSTQLGFRTVQTVDLGNGSTLGTETRTAWVHDFAPQTKIGASFESIAQSDFTVPGAPQARDALLLSARAQIKFVNGFAISGTFDSQLARNSRSYSGMGQVRYVW